MEQYEKIFKYIAIVFFGVFVGVLVHELSHATVAILCGGAVADISFGAKSYVNAYVEPKYFVYVSMASIVLPTILLVFSFTRIPMYFRTWYSCFWTGFSIEALMTSGLNFIVFPFVYGDHRQTWDLLMAMDSVPRAGKIICVIICGICMVVSFFVLLYHYRYTLKHYELI